MWTEKLVKPFALHLEDDAASGGGELLPPEEHISDSPGPVEPPPQPEAPPLLTDEMKNHGAWIETAKGKSFISADDAIRSIRPLRQSNYTLKEENVRLLQELDMLRGQQAIQQQQQQPPPTEQPQLPSLDSLSETEYVPEALIDLIKTYGEQLGELSQFKETILTQQQQMQQQQMINTVDAQVTDLANQYLSKDSMFAGDETVQQRIKIRAAELMSPYTNPNGYLNYSRDLNAAVFDAQKEVLESERARYNGYITKYTDAIKAQIQNNERAVGQGAGGTAPIPEKQQPPPNETRQQRADRYQRDFELEEARLKDALQR